MSTTINGTVPATNNSLGTGEVLKSSALTTADKEVKGYKAGKKKTTLTEQVALLTKAFQDMMKSVMGMLENMMKMIQSSTSTGSTSTGTLPSTAGSSPTSGSSTATGSTPSTGTTASTSSTGTTGSTTTSGSASTTTGTPATGTPSTTASTGSSATGGTNSAAAGSSSLSPLQIVSNENGQNVVVTDDGYKLLFEGKDEAFKIINPDGSESRIWGDPHVTESDGTAQWDFMEQATFVFGKNKLTVEVVPYTNAAMLAKQVSIYNGEQRVTIDDINLNKPRIETVGNDARAHDASLTDGLVFLYKKTGEKTFEWVKQAAPSQG